MKDANEIMRQKEIFDSTKTMNRTLYLNRRQTNIRSETRTKEIKKRWELEDRIRQEKLQKKLQRSKEKKPHERQ